MTPEIKWIFGIIFTLLQMGTMLIIALGTYSYKRDQTVLKEKQVEQDHKYDKMEKRQDEIETNYLDRFDKVYLTMNNNHKEVMKTINENVMVHITDIKVEIAKMSVPQIINNQQGGSK